MEPEGERVPRLAATVIVAREGEGGVEVLVLRRGSGHRFLPGYVVFPGGAVDSEDRELAAKWFRAQEEAARACAVRELIEEAGLVLTSEGIAEARTNAIGAVSGSPPSRDALVEISHWVAPEEVPVRFDARFFAVAALGGLEPRADGDEAEAAWWARPTDVLDDYRQGRCDLYWPTFKTMEALASCASVDEVLSLRIPQVEAE